ncbi:MAG: hypothetical protein JST00_40900 [Deltaproteobacteria bacterium]|nr:hypothetical protein [Deltaproteobacteria bacterium]
MKRIMIPVLTLAISAGVLHVACSSDDPPAQTTTPDASTTTSSSNGSSGTVTEPQNTDTCRPAGGTCLCTCTFTGQTEDKTKKCAQPNQGTGECRKVCCTGPGSSSGTSGTSSSSGDSGDVDGG